MAVAGWAADFIAQSWVMEYGASCPWLSNEEAKVTEHGYFLMPMPHELIFI